jgi:Holliday junction resolvasome RuvABC DNA-binding subunit
LELKNKIMHADLGERKDVHLESESEAMDALVALGYTQYQAREALKHVGAGITSTEEKITEGLKILAKK